MSNLPYNKPGRVKLNNTSGQALLIVLLGMAVVLTMVLSVVSRSVTDIELTTKDDETLRAFSAAEAGIENVLIVGENVSESDFGDGASFTATATGIAEGLTNYVIPKEFYAGESGTIWFVSHDDDDETVLLCDDDNPCFNGRRMNVCFASAGTGNTGDRAPAIEVTVYYDDPANPSALGAGADYRNVQAKRAVYDSRTSVRDPDNNFHYAPSGCYMTEHAGLFQYQSNVFLFDSDLGISCWDQNGCLLFARVKYIYNYIAPPHPIGVRVTGDVLPAQGLNIDSIGSAGESTINIIDLTTYREPPSVFDNAVFSMGDDVNANLTK